MHEVYGFAGYGVQIEGLSKNMVKFMEKYKVSSTPEIYLEISEKDAIDKGQMNITLEKLARGLLQKDVILIHGSAIAYQGRCYVFCAPSGTGKSTHTALWRDLLGEEAYMVNDDKPFIRIENEGAKVCGSPFNGKHRLSSNVMVPLKSICFLSQAPENSITEMKYQDILPDLIECTYRPDTSEEVIHVINLLEEIGKNTKFYSMRCTPRPEAAKMAIEMMM